jgi:hypothetical protein
MMIRICRLNWILHHATLKLPPSPRVAAPGNEERMAA